MKKGFSLAEMTLVTAIIGVITAICVTPVINNTQNKEWSALTKKAMTTLQDAIDMKTSNYGWPTDGNSIPLLYWLARGESQTNYAERGVIELVEQGSNYQYVKTKTNIVYFAQNGYYYEASQCLTSPLTPENSCRICADINGTEPPTTGYTPSNWTSKLQNKINDSAARDIICMQVEKGIVRVRTGCTDLACKRFEQYMYETE